MFKRKLSSQCREPSAAQSAVIVRRRVQHSSGTHRRAGGWPAGRPARRQLRGPSARRWTALRWRKGSPPSPRTRRRAGGGTSPRSAARWPTTARRAAREHATGAQTMEGERGGSLSPGKSTLSCQSRTCLRAKAERRERIHRLPIIVALERTNGNSEAQVSRCGRSHQLGTRPGGWDWPAKLPSRKAPHLKRDFGQISTNLNQPP